MSQPNFKYRVRADYWIDLPAIPNEDELLALKRQIEKFIEQESGVTHSISTERRNYRIRVETCVSDFERERKGDGVESYDESNDRWQPIRSNVHHFTQRELDIVLAGLRALQELEDGSRFALHYSNLISPDNEEIDRLCEIINFNSR